MKENNGRATGGKVSEMTKYEATMNAVNVLTTHRSTGNGVNDQHDYQSGTPIRFIPVSVVSETDGRREWSGSHGIIYRTKTGKLVVVMTDWSCIDGNSDGRFACSARSEREMFDLLTDCEMTEAPSLCAALARRFEVVPTI